MSVLNIKRAREDIILPTYDENLQYIIYSPCEKSIEAHKTASIPTGLHVSFPKNYAALMIENGCGDILGGLVDSDYRGELHVIIDSDKDIKISKGQPIARIILIEIEHPNIICEEKLSSSEEEEPCNMSLDK